MYVLHETCVLADLTLEVECAKMAPGRLNLSTTHESLGKLWKTLAKFNAHMMPQGVSRVGTGKMAVFQSFLSSWLRKIMVPVQGVDVASSETEDTTSTP